MALRIVSPEENITSSNPEQMRTGSFVFLSRLVIDGHTVASKNGETQKQRVQTLTARILKLPTDSRPTYQLADVIVKEPAKPGAPIKPDWATGYTVVLPVEEVHNIRAITDAEHGVDVIAGQTAIPHDSEINHARPEIAEPLASVAERRAPAGQMSITTQFAA